MVIFDEKKKENDYLADKAKDVNAYVSDTKLKISQLLDRDDVTDKVKSGDPGQGLMAVTAVSDKDASVAENVRSANKSAGIMIVADETVSPKRYLTPKIKASSLLLRPYSDDEASDTMKEFLSDFYARDDIRKKNIVIGSRGNKHAVSLSEIYYIEAKGKKVLFRLKNRELSEYASFETVLKALGDNFVRCHRSFAFNMDYFMSVKLSDNQIKLMHGMTVPLSRTYKAMMREWIETFEKK